LELFRCVDQFLWLVLVGVEKEENIRCYRSDLDRYENSNYNIEMFDGWLWYIFSVDKPFLNRLKKRFKETEPISPDKTADWQRY